MEPQKRTHLVNQLMEEATLMQSVLAKAMEGQRTEARQLHLHSTQHAHAAYSCSMSMPLGRRSGRRCRGFKRNSSRLPTRNGSVWSGKAVCGYERVVETPPVGKGYMGKDLWHSTSRTHIRPSLAG